MARHYPGGVPVYDLAAAAKRVTNGTDLERSGLVLFTTAVARGESTRQSAGVSALMRLGAPVVAVAGARPRARARRAPPGPGAVVGVFRIVAALTIERLA